MKPTQIIPSKIRGFKFQGQEFHYDEYKAIRYALGLGVSQDPLNLPDLNFTYENAEDFKILPTFGVTTVSHDTGYEALLICGGFPDFNPMMLLHGEHKFELLKPFSKKQRLRNEGEISDVADKGSGALVTLTTTSFDESNSPVCRNTSRLFLRGLGGFGDKGVLKGESVPKAPSTPPHKVSILKTTANQAILYRLAGDHNPLHIAPHMAKLGGFDRPILHGLCFFGIAGRAVLKEFCGDDVRRFKSISARFTSHVFPGETVVTEMWGSGQGVYFQQRTEERGKICSQGMVELIEVSPKI